MRDNEILGLSDLICTTIIIYVELDTMRAPLTTVYLINALDERASESIPAPAHCIVRHVSLHPTHNMYETCYTLSSARAPEYGPCRRSRVSADERFRVLSNEM